MSEKASECVTHHYACECREAEFKKITEVNKVLVEALESIAKNKTEDCEIYTMGCDCDDVAIIALAKAKKMSK